MSFIHYNDLKMCKRSQDPLNRSMRYGCRSYIRRMNIKAVCSVVPWRLRGPLDVASPLWNKGGLTGSTDARGEPPLHAWQTCCPVLPTSWSNSRTFCGSVAKRMSLWSSSMLVHRRGRGAVAPPRATRWAKHSPAVRAVPGRAGDVERDPHVLRCATASRGAGARRVSRPLPGQHTVWPWARRRGIRAGAWTPLAAQPAPGVVAPVTPQAGEARLDRWGPCHQRNVCASGGPPPCTALGRRHARAVPRRGVLRQRSRQRR
jgi:hypothetical protein